MKLNYELENSFHPASKVWVYQSNRLFTMNEALEVEEILNEFATHWKSHGETVKGGAYLFFGQFVVLMADQSTSVSGCSTDSSVRLIKDIEQRFGVNMFDRTALAFVIKDKVQLLPFSQLQYAVDNGFVDGETLYFNNLVDTKEDLESKWIIPVKDSWLAKKIVLARQVS
ncbi:MAG: hypothetical protein H7Y42_08870 [Chitinophagaceae bacterium]|nr:hypothetical protein [Chitinophagaceae bacterium]